MSVHSNSRWGFLGPALFVGFASTVLTWCVWFVTHLPWLEMPEQAATPLTIAAWWMAIAWLAGRLPKGRALVTGVGAGLISAVLGLLILGSKLTERADVNNETAGLIPSAPLLALGFVVLGVVIGALGGVVGRMIARPDAPEVDGRVWLGRFAVVTVVAMAPLLFIGGLVTSTNSGMAVPDWPRTFGANMFLYPLGSHTRADIYLEHAHRLFGTLIGLTSLTLMVMTIVIDRRTWVKVFAAVVFALVCVQGILGGFRVIEDERLAAMIHGVLAQLIFGATAGLAVALSPTFREIGERGVDVDPAVVKRFKTFATAATHTLILQLIMGAWYRHFRADHPLYTHIVLSVVVVVLVLLAAFTLNSPAMRASLVGQRCGWIGTWLVIVVGVQFALGWVAFIFGGKTVQAETIAQALIRTSHQANGALIIALVAAAYAWALRVKRVASGRGPRGGAFEPTVVPVA